MEVQLVIMLFFKHNSVRYVWIKNENELMDSITEQVRREVHI